MKALSFTLLAAVALANCKPLAPVEPNSENTPSFNQVNIAFETNQARCLLNQWYERTYKNEPIGFRPINHASTQAAFFPVH